MRIWIVRVLHQRSQRMSWDTDTNRSDWAMLAPSAGDALAQFRTASKGRVGRSWPSFNPENTSNPVAPRVQVWPWPDGEPLYLNLRALGAGGQQPALDLSMEEAEELEREPDA